jgi:hypothetical protein
VHAPLACFEHVVDRVGGVVAMRTEDVGHDASDAAPMIVIVVVVFVVVVVVRRADAVLVGHAVCLFAW